jgi:hypothetical protein
MAGGTMSCIRFRSHLIKLLAEAADVVAAAAAESDPEQSVAVDQDSEFF